MIFTTQCPSCEATFPIDPRKVPSGGVYARCSHCEGVFLVEVPATADVSATTPETLAPGARTSPSDLDTEEPPPVEQEEVVAPEPEVPPVFKTADVTDVSDEAEAESDPSVPTAAFGKRDPNERAQRLARVLVSDMIAYHPDRHRRSLEEGTLKSDFDEEIDKSWHEYVDQVGRELAKSTPYFTDALNEILAKGETVFE